MALTRLVLVASTVVAMSTVAGQPARAAEGGARHVLYAGQQIVAGTTNDSLSVGNHAFELTVYPYYMELDQNGPMGPAVWATDDQAKPHPRHADHTTLRMQRNGNLVLLTSHKLKMWQSGTRGKGYRLVLLPGGNMVIRNSHDKTVWATHTTSVLLSNGQTLNSGRRLTYRWGYWFHPAPYSSLTMQRDGNLVYRCRGLTAWATRTHVSGSNLTMRRDGNLVVRGPAGRILWRSHTHGAGLNTYLDIRDMQLKSGIRTVWSADRGPAAYACI